MQGKSVRNWVAADHKEFLGLRTNSRVKTRHEKAGRKVVVHITKGELWEFRHRVRDILGSFLKLFVAHRVEPGTTFKRSREGPGHKLERYPYWEERSPLAERRAPSVRDIELPDIPVSLWIAAILIFGFGDSLTSTLTFSVGAHEVNPLMVSLVSVFGGRLWTFILVKTAALAGLFFLSYYMLPRHGWLVPTLLCVVGTYLVISNLIAFFTII